MNTVNRIKVPCSALEGLIFDKIIVSEDKDKAINNVSTKCENMTENNEYDRVFGNIDAIDGMRIGTMEISKDDVSLKGNLKSFVPIKSYSGKLKIINIYENKVKG